MKRQSNSRFSVFIAAVAFAVPTVAWAEACETEVAEELEAAARELRSALVHEISEMITDPVEQGFECLTDIFNSGFGAGWSFSPPSLGDLLENMAGRFCDATAEMFGNFTEQVNDAMPRISLGEYASVDLGFGETREFRGGDGYYTQTIGGEERSRNIDDVIRDATGLESAPTFDPGIVDRIFQPPGSTN